MALREPKTMNISATRAVGSVVLACARYQSAKVVSPRRSGMPLGSVLALSSSS